jgi:branched-chain amino acid transport system substrate-binding protein
MFERVLGKGFAGGQTQGSAKGLAKRLDRRKVLAAAALALLAACKTVPTGPSKPPPEPERPTSSLPADTERHRVALIVPLSGPNGAIGQSIANAATMAVLDTNADNLRITTYDSAAGIPAAANRAIADGNKLILGPLMGDDIPVVATAARAARVPVISFSNDTTVTGRDVYIMGTVPEQSIERTVRYARAQGANRFAALIPSGEYGERVSGAVLAAVRAGGGTMVAMENYDRSAAAVGAAVRRLNTRGPFDAVLIADGGRIALQAAPLLKTARGTGPRILGTELWSGEAGISTAPALRGAWYSAVSDTRYRQFADSYRTRFGSPPYRLATLGYDAVLLTLRIARDWRPGTALPTGKLNDRGGFLGLDGAFRFDHGIIERAFEVREIRAGGVSVVSPAPAKFAD